MPMATAVKLCPEAVCMPPRFDVYHEVSQQIREIFVEVTPEIEPIALDESFLDVTSRCRSTGEKAGTVAWNIREQIQAKLSLTASAGVGPNKLVAKIASGFRKPNGLTVVAPEQVLEFLGPLSVSELWGVGPVATARLAQLGVNTVVQLRELELHALIRNFGKFGQSLFDMCRGIDERPVESQRQTKSVSSERTFETDIPLEADLEYLSVILGWQAEEVARRLQSERLEGYTVTLKLKMADFSQRTRSFTAKRASDSPEVISKIAIDLLRAEASTERIRLIGVGASNLISKDRPQQLELNYTL